MTDKTKTIGDLLVEANKSGDPKAIQEAMKLLWGAAKKVGLPTPDTHPPFPAKDEASK